MKKWFIFPLLFLFAFQVEAQFMQIEDIPGESLDDKHKGWCNVAYFSFNVSSPNSEHIGSQNTNPNFETITIKKVVDKASPKIIDALAKGTILKKVIFDLASDQSMKYVQIVLTNVRIINYQLSGLAGNRLREELSLSFEKIKYTYKKEEFNWNTKTNSPK